LQVLVWGTVPTAEGTMLPIVKLANVGMARVREEGPRRSWEPMSACLAPELVRRRILGENIDTQAAADVYSLGALLYAVVALENPVPPPAGAGQAAWARLVASGAVHWAHPRITAMSADCVELMRLMMDVSPSTRITATQALSHRWFDTIRSSAVQLPLVAVAAA
jgi:serine/threonine protein kinase